jgi:hypothetical protein
MTPDELRRTRFAAQGLAATRRRAPADVVRALLGVQRALTAPAALTTNRRRLGEEGVPPPDADRAVTVIEQALDDGPLHRAELANLVSAAGIRTEGQAIRTS